MIIKDIHIRFCAHCSKKIDKEEWEPDWEEDVIAYICDMCCHFEQILRGHYTDFVV